MNSKKNSCRGNYMRKYGRHPKFDDNFDIWRQSKHFQYEMDQTWMMNLKDSLQIDEIFFSIVFHLNRMNLLNSMWSDSTEIIFDIFLFLSKWWKLSMVPYRLLSLLPLEMLVPKFKIFHLLEAYFYSSQFTLLVLIDFCPV